MHVVIAGASGLIGTALVDALRDQGHDVTRLVRRQANATDEVTWDPTEDELDASVIEGADAIINLAGAGIGDRRWSADYKRLLVESRVDTTSLLARTAAAANEKPSVFIGGSAIGYYGDREDEILTEQSHQGAGFLADLCRGWEDAAKAALDAGIRTVSLRSGIVLSTNGGVLPRLLPLFKLGVGGQFGSGDQYMSWISIADEVAAIIFALENDVEGPLNLTAPDPKPNSDFTDSLARALNRPSFIPVPKFGPRLLMGRERANALLFESQQVMPEALQALGFTFAHPTLEEALSYLLANG